MAEGSYEFWNTIFDGVKRCGRTVEMDLHAKGIDEKMIANALATGMPVNVSEVISDPIIKEATDALKAGGASADPKDVHSVVNANKELLSLHELIAHRLFQILIGAHRGRTYSL